MDPLAAASALVDTIAPALAEFGKAAADKLGAGLVASALGWVRDKSSGRAKQALVELEEEPDSTGRRAMLSEELAKQLKANPELLAQLRDLLAQQPQAGDRMQLNVTGAGAKAAQIKGHGNKVMF